MRKVSKTSELPAWFDLRNYKGVEGFGPTEWLASLRIRKNILDGFSMLMNALSIDDPERCVRYARDKMPELICELETIRRSPLDASGCGSWANLLADFDDGSPSCPIRPLLMSDIAKVYSTDRYRVENGQAPERDLERWDSIFEWPAVPANTSEVPLDLQLESPHDLNKEASHETNTKPHGTLFVDLRCNDAVLKQAFSQWLESTRDSWRERLALHNWRRFGLLPYLDLMIWEKEKGNQLTRSLMAKSVGYVSGGDNFQKTVPSLADELMDDLGELEAIVSVERKS
ncbi:DUF6387 family protein [Marinobacter sp. ATCH36]|uniref:DUF6387 family protein n=1 Tax=Marinobacter sp. ATCH36 TaxID=2945106 RepID=UPI00202067F9|nr:DUF6387 family protein [Marinobacter sp. ATCH36]